MKTTKYFKSHVGKYLSNGQGKTFCFAQEVMPVDSSDADLIDMMGRAIGIEEVKGVQVLEPDTTSESPAELSKKELIEAIAEAGGDIKGNENKKQLTEILNAL